MAFVLRGNIAFNSDEAVACDYVRKLLAGRLRDFTGGYDLAGFRLAVACLFQWLTDGWVYFGSLAAIFTNGLFSVIWVYWLDRRVSRIAALGSAVILAFPPICTAYYSTHFEERRMETLFWASWLVLLSGGWLASRRKALLFGLLVGWSYWCEPFILFFAVPVLAFEIWTRQKKSGSVWMKAALMGTGLALGGVAGLKWNRPFTILGDWYLHWGPQSWHGIKGNARMLAEVYPQYWNGNFPFGYLQSSAFGQWLDPVRGGIWAVFLGFWALALFALSVGGCVMLARRKEPGGAWLSALIWIPALLYFLFFVFSSQVWDATSFRYLDYWVVFAALGGGLAFHQLFLWRRGAAVFAVSLFVLVQGFLLVQEFRRLPAEFPAVRIVHNLERLGFKRCLANHWVAEAGTYLSGGRVFMVEYKFVGDLPGWKEILAGRRIGLVVLEGLDSGRDVDNTVRALAADGVRYTKTWPMLGKWFVLEFHKEEGGRRWHGARPDAERQGER